MQHRPLGSEPADGRLETIAEKGDSSPKDEPSPSTDPQPAAKKKADKAGAASKAAGVTPKPKKAAPKAK